MKFEVTADMSVVLRIVVEAPNEDEAIRLAKDMADNGQMEEVEHSGDVSGWTAIPARQVIRDK
jgi:hypothetical protein